LDLGSTVRRRKKESRTEDPYQPSNQPGGVTSTHATSEHGKLIATRPLIEADKGAQVIPRRSRYVTFSLLLKRFEQLSLTSPSFFAEATESQFSKEQMKCSACEGLPC
jgi:hypothetical protein